MNLRSLISSLMTVVVVCGSVAGTTPALRPFEEILPQAVGVTTFNTLSFNRHPAGNRVLTGLGLVGTGALLFNKDGGFRTLRNGYMPGFRHHYDDYMQYSPAAVMLGLKAFGVEGRSSWGRMLTVDAISVAGTVLLANGTKLRRLRERPDGADRRSMPSGHTATAFLAASLLHKEYGHLSPWVSIGGYTVATATGVSRMMNNKHWLSDVLVGAGIGVITAEFGYWVGGKIFGERGLNLREEYIFIPDFHRRDGPSFFGIAPGFLVSLWGGSRIGVEGAWFFNKSLGVGGTLFAANIPSTNEGMYIPGYNTTSAQAGIYYAGRTATRWILGAKALTGVAVKQPLLSRETSYTDAHLYPRKTLLTGTIGVSATFLATPGFGIRAFVDLDIAACSPQHTHALSAVSAGLSFDAMLW